VRGQGRPACLRDRYGEPVPEAVDFRPRGRAELKGSITVRQRGPGPREAVGQQGPVAPWSALRTSGLRGGTGFPDGPRGVDLSGVVWPGAQDGQTVGETVALPYGTTGRQLTACDRRAWRKCRVIGGTEIFRPPKLASKSRGSNWDELEFRLQALRNGTHSGPNQTPGEVRAPVSFVFGEAHDLER